MKSGEKRSYEQLRMPIPGEPDAPKLWLVKTSETSFVVEWSEPKSYGIPVIGFQLFIEGKKAGEMIAMNLHRAEIPSNQNRTYEINICAVTDHPQRTRSVMSQTLAVVTTPTRNQILQTMFYPDESSTRNNERPSTIVVQIDPISEERLQLDWSMYLAPLNIRAYYIQYICLNNGEIQTMKISKRHQKTVRSPQVDRSMLIFVFVRSYEI